tara:strand:+ start:245 stop:532 length:288 start_codon:yes stop_codon:yes gene_type:complete
MNPKERQQLNFHLEQQSAHFQLRCNHWHVNLVEGNQQDISYNFRVPRSWQKVQVSTVNIELGQTYLENNQDDNDDILQLEHLNQNETSQQDISHN